MVAEPVAVTVIDDENARYRVPKEVVVMIGADPVTLPENALSL